MIDYRKCFMQAPSQSAGPARAVHRRLQRGNAGSNQARLSYSGRLAGQADGGFVPMPEASCSARSRARAGVTRRLRPHEGGRTWVHKLRSEYLIGQANAAVRPIDRAELVGESRVLGAPVPEIVEVNPRDPRVDVREIVQDPGRRLG